MKMAALVPFQTDFSASAPVNYFFPAVCLLLLHLPWAAVMLAGAAGSRFISGYFAVAAYVVWIVLFFREVHLDARKAFEKYLL